MPSGRLEEIFADAIEFEAPDERRRFVDQACGDDVEVHAGVLALLRAHELAGDFMDEEIPEQDVSDLSGESIGPYTLIDRLGSGGFGVVYRALQTEPVRREVALKVIKPGMDTREVIGRFNAERQALAMMNHPAIARVLGAGSTPAGRPYFVMELFEGDPITIFCDNHQLRVHQRLTLLADVCDAVQHAHQKGIIHRDLKPSNILVADISGSPAIKIIDFGVAKALGDSLTDHTLVTRQGQPLGTLRYMSPEQFEESTGVDTRSDVYALGVVLYELLTGTTPLRRESLRGSTLDRLRQAILDEDPDVPSQRIRSIDSDRVQPKDTHQLDARRLSQFVKGDLDWLVIKALEKDPERRYPTASALAEDIRRFLRSEPVDAGPPTRLYRLRKLARRHRAALATATLVVASMLVGTGLATWNSWRASLAENLAERRATAVESEQRKTRAALAMAEAAESAQRELRQQAEQRERELQQVLYASDLQLAGRAYNDGDIRTFVDLLKRHRPDDAQPDLRGFEWWVLWNQTMMQPTSVTQGRSGACLARFTPDGRWLVTGHYDGKLHLWDPDTFERALTLNGHDSFANGIDVDVDGQIMVSAGDDHRIRFWDLNSGEQVDSAVADDGHVYRVFFWEEGKRLVSAGEAAEVKIWSRSPLEVIDRKGSFETAVHHGIKNRLDISPDRRRCVAADQFQTARVYDLETGEVVFALDQTGGQSIRCLRYSPDGRWIAGGRYTQEVTLWDATTGEVVDRFHGHFDDVQDLAFHPHGHRLATSDKSGIVRTWVLPSGDQKRHNNSGFHEDWPPFYVAHDDRVFSLDFSRDGSTLVTACRDGTVRRWHAEKTPRYVTGFTPLEPQTVWLDETRLAVVDDKRLVFWDTRQETRTPTSSFEPIQSLVVSLNGQQLATGHFDGSLRIWNVTTGEVERTLNRHEGTIHALAFTSQSDHLISAGDDGLLVRWNIADGRAQVLHEFPNHCKSVTVSPNGSLAAVAVQNDIFLFQLNDRSTPKRLSGHLNSVDCLAFSPNGKWLASGSDDRTVRLWDAETGTPQHVIPAHRSKVESIAFSPDGRTIVSGDKSASLSFSHVKTGRLLCKLDLLRYWDDLDVPDENPWVSDLKFIEDGSRLAVGMFRMGYLVLRGPAPHVADVSETQTAAP